MSHPVPGYEYEETKDSDEYHRGPKDKARYLKSLRGALNKKKSASSLIGRLKSLVRQSRDIRKGKLNSSM